MADEAVRPREPLRLYYGCVVAAGSVVGCVCEYIIIAWPICRRFSAFCSRVRRLGRSGAASGAAGAVAGGLVEADGAAGLSHPRCIAAPTTMNADAASFSCPMFFL
jgi:hypothetical protein